MQRCDHLSTLADRGGDPLDRRCTDIADGEDAAPAGLQHMSKRAGVGAGQHKALGVERNARAGKPIGVRLGADEEKQVANGPLHILSGAIEDRKSVV